jgi:hypothetical protein
MRDVLGILRCDTLTSSEFAIYKGHNVHFCAEGVVPVTCNAIAGLAGDPDKTDLAAFSRFYWRTNRHPADLKRTINQSTMTRPL